MRTNIWGVICASLLCAACGTYDGQWRSTPGPRPELARPQTKNITYRQIGNVTAGSDGQTYTKTGGQTSGPGGYYRTLGNRTTAPNGVTYRTVGNTITASDGTTYRTVGNVTYGSDGSVYTRIGNMVKAKNVPEGKSGFVPGVTD